MKKIIFQFLLGLPLVAFAHGGEDHADAKKATAGGSLAYFSSEAFSDKYELLVKYNPIIPGKEAILRLFISEYNTNKPLDSTTLQVTVTGNPGIKVTIRRIDKGIYELTTNFPEKKAYSLFVNINSAAGADLIQLNNIEAGKELSVAETESNAHIHWYSSNWFFGLMGLLIGLIAMFFIRKTRSRKITTTAILLLCLLPTATYNSVSAHDGESHGGKLKRVVLQLCL